MHAFYDIRLQCVAPHMTMRHPQVTFVEGAFSTATLVGVRHHAAAHIIYKG